MHNYVNNLVGLRKCVQCRYKERELLGANTKGIK
jgi:Zn ribbon nucleic-acid-binding protein